jgi:uncharacterized membrane protein YkvA (DUF1232 family)
MSDKITLAMAMEKVGIDSSNARERATGVRRSAKKWLDRAPAPVGLKNFVLQFVNAATDLDMPAVDLAIVVAAVAYVIMPLDFIPDFIPLLGWGDDATIAAIALKTLQRHWKRSAQHGLQKGDDVVVETTSRTP